MIKIDKDIKRPEKWGGLTKYPLDIMEIGDSIFIEMEKAPGGIHNRAHEKGIKVSYRKWEEDGRKGYRIWRVK